MSMITNFVVTGASSDIGGILVRTIIDQGGRVLATGYRNTPKEGMGDGVGYHFMQGMNLLDVTCLEQLREQVRSRFSERFALVHCAGDFWRHKPLVHTQLTEISSMVNSHYVTLANTTQILLPMMIKAGGGAIVAFSCNSVGYSYPDMSPFTASKAAVEAFMKCMANEYSQYEIGRAHV